MAACEVPWKRAPQGNYAWGLRIGAAAEPDFGWGSRPCTSSKQCNEFTAPSVAALSLP